MRDCDFKYVNSVVVLLTALLFGGASDATADELAIRVHAVSAAEGRTVLSVGSESPSTRNVGELVGRYVILKILEDRVVLEERKLGEEPEQIWVYLADAKGVSRVQRLARSEERPRPTRKVRRETQRPGEDPAQRSGAGK